MDFNSKKCPKCKGKKAFHIADRISFAGDKSQFSLAGLRNSAIHYGLRAHGDQAEIMALITTANSRSSSSVRNAEARGIAIFSPENFEKELRNVCDGNVPSVANPKFSTQVELGGKIFFWGLNPDQEKKLTRFLKKNDIKRGIMKKNSLAAAITTTLFAKSGEAKVFGYLGVPVYDYARIKSSLEI